LIEREQEMKKNGITLVEILLVILIVGILGAIIAPQFAKIPSITVRIEFTDPEDITESMLVLVYDARNQYDYKRLKFKDFGLDGSLNKIQNPDGTEIEIITPIPGEITEDPKLATWATWVTRFEEEIRPKAVPRE